MVNNGAKTASLNCGGSYTIPAGYHNGSGKITANTAASQSLYTKAQYDSNYTTGYNAGVAATKEQFPISLNWALVTSVTSKCYSNGADVKTYAISTAGIYCVILAAGGYGSVEAEAYLTTPGTTLYNYQFHTTVNDKCQVIIRFIKVTTGTVKWGFPCQKNTRGTGLLFKIN